MSNLNPAQPSLTPNVVVANPHVRKVMNVVLGITALILPILGIVDAGAEGFSFGAWLPIAAQIDLFLIGAFNLGVINQNIPTATFDAKVDAKLARGEGMGNGGGLA
jgi:hypothetical protein